ncbi:MAG: antirestriction protein ArdA [Hyphomicrobiales bacterium]
MTTFFAQPYNTAAEGFYFQTAEQYAEKSRGLTDPFGQPVEEFEIQFIDGGQLSCELFEAWRPGQCEVGRFIEVCDIWSEDAFLMAIIALRDLGYSTDQVLDDPEDLPITLYRIDSLKDLAEQFVEEGLFGDIPERLASYLDYEAIARDLGFDGYCETIIAGERLVYCAQ